jgi:hypothetical protein
MATDYKIILPTATISAFDVPEDIAPKQSPMSGKRPDLQAYDPYSLDPTVMAFDPLQQIGEMTGGPEAKVYTKAIRTRQSLCGKCFGVGCLNADEVCIRITDYL